MAAKSKSQITLKLMINKENDRVVFAEADKDLVDILFSFLTMPMGTIVRLLDKQPTPARIGSFTSLYHGVADFSTEFLSSEICKEMLLHPKNSAETLVRNLKLNIDDTKSTEYFISEEGCSHMSTLKNMRCGCNYLDTGEFRLNEMVSCMDSTGHVGTGGLGGVFIKAGAAMFIISDDLQVLPASFDSIHTLLSNLNIKDMEALHQRIVNVGLEEIRQILMLSLLSKSALTDTFLRDHGLNPSSRNLGSFNKRKEIETTADGKKIIVELIVGKVDNKVLYAEVTEDFVDLLFSLLTFPLGLVVELLGGDSSLNCVDNLYKSVGDLSVERFMGSKDLKEMLLSPKLPPNYLCMNQFLDVKEVNVTPQLGTEYIWGGEPGDTKYAAKYVTFTGQEELEFTIRPMTLLDPRSPNGNTAAVQGHVKGPATFMVTNDLIVTPLSSISSFCLLNSLNADINSVEKRMISVGKEEALSLLKASLYSSSALSIVFDSILQKQDSNLQMTKQKMKQES